MKTRLAGLLSLLMLAAAPVAADTWSVNYIGASNWGSTFFPSGAYFFLCCDNGGAGGVLYGLTAEGGWKYLPGYYVYGETPLVPSAIPQITLTSNAFNPGTGNFEAVAFVRAAELPWDGLRYSAPYWLQVMTANAVALVTGGTAVAATVIAPGRWIVIDPQCTGLVMMLYWTVLALCVSYFVTSWRWRVALVALAPFVGFAMNVWRIMGLA